MKETWKYLKVGRVKHFFMNPFEQAAVCGVGSRWYVAEDFKTDTKGLKARKQCRRCVRIRRANAVSSNSNG